MGGAQVNHSLCRSIFLEGHTILGDAMMNTRRTFWSEICYAMWHGQRIEFRTDMFPGSEWYTQRSTILLGDPSLRIWTALPGVLELVGSPSFKPGYNVIEVTVTANGVPAEGILVTLSQVGGVLVTKISEASGRVQFRANLKPQGRVHITAYAPNMVTAVIDSSR